MKGEEILREIDNTLEQLLQNADVLQQIDDNPEYCQEKQALEKTQDSLLAHLIHMDCLLDREKISMKKKENTACNISQTLSSINRLDEDFIEKICENFLQPARRAGTGKNSQKKVSKPAVRKKRKHKVNVI